MTSYCCPAIIFSPPNTSQSGKETRARGRIPSPQWEPDTPIPGISQSGIAARPNHKILPLILGTITLSQPNLLPMTLMSIKWRRGGSYGPLNCRAPPSRGRTEPAGLRERTEEKAAGKMSVTVFAFPKPLNYWGALTEVAL